MDINIILISILSMGGLGLLFSVGLSIAHQKLHVKEDERISLILQELPNVNCGGCGFPGCANFAEQLVADKADVSECVAISAEASEKIAMILGKTVTQKEKVIARILCQGGHYETAKKGTYLGIHSCIGATFAGGGDKLCMYSCIGYGDCVKACPFNAIYMNDNGLPVVIDDKCTGCGKCVEACPRNIIELHPLNHKLFVLCKNEDQPKYARKLCLKACISCGICVRAVEEGKMSMVNNLAKVNYQTYGSDLTLPTEKCPTNCLVILNTQGNKQKTK
jgi:Na+-translocating ferredoxin:NAD+ oxidoreductase RNF subunit RnfB